jgi:glycosyltransferase involved in cell wall biosynthesis
VAVVTTDPGDGLLERSDVYRAPAKKVAGAPVAPTFPALLYSVARDFRPDVIHGYYPLPFYPDVAAAYARLSGTPFVLTCFGAWESTLDSLIGTMGFAYNNTVLRATLRTADAVHTLSPGVLSQIDTYDGFEDLFHVIPPGVDVTDFDPENVNVDPPFNRDEDAEVLLFVGVLRRYKGMQTLLEAVDQIREERDIKLAVVGEGPREQAIRETISRNGLKDTVDLMGHVSNAELLAAYAGADAFVLPSPNIRESFGVVVSEALAMDTPVIATEGSGSGTYLAERDIGTVVEPANATALANGIQRTLDEDRVSEMRSFVEEKLAWSSVVDDYEDLYESVCE